MEERRYPRGQVLAVPYPSQGHVNPMLQFCKRLASKGLKTTFAVTNFISNTFNPQSTDSVHFETISDGCETAGFAEADSISDYLNRLEFSGTKTLTELIMKYQNSENPFLCIVYDAFLPWALDVSNSFGLVCAPFFTQSCAVNLIYYNIYHGLLKLPPSSSSPISIPGLPLLDLQDMPSFVSASGSYPPYFALVLNQFSNVHKADFVLVNTVHQFEAEEVEAMSKVFPLLTVGPTVPSFYLDKSVYEDKEYGLNLFKTDESFLTGQWLGTKPRGSVIYVSFGSMANLSNTQMEELALGLKESNCCFMWVVRKSEKAKLPKWMEEDEEKERWLIVEWSSQLEVLSNEAVGCFFTHCGWNSTLEAICVGVPTIVMPQWTDQATNAKYITDIWKVGVRVKVEESGLVPKEEIKNCISQIMGGEKSAEIKENAAKWKGIALEAIAVGRDEKCRRRSFGERESCSSKCNLIPCCVVLQLHSRI